MTRYHLLAVFAAAVVVMVLVTVWVCLWPRRR